MAVNHHALYGNYVSLYLECDARIGQCSGQQEELAADVAALILRGNEPQCQARSSCLICTQFMAIFTRQAIYSLKYIMVQSAFLKLYSEYIFLCKYTATLLHFLFEKNKSSEVLGKKIFAEFENVHTVNTDCSTFKFSKLSKLVNNLS